MKRLLLSLIFLALAQMLPAQIHPQLIEAESFADKGGWVVDPQFVEQMGSPYLLAHGMGHPVKDAETQFSLDHQCNCIVWVRTKNWAPGNWEAPGRFSLLIDGKQLSSQLGTRNGWGWQQAGTIRLEAGNHRIALHDLTGFEGRCDAIYLTEKSGDQPPADGASLRQWRSAFQPVDRPDQTVVCDLVVAGGGIAGCAAAIAAAEHGMEVALIHDRGVLGGNASSEIRVHTLGIYGKFERILRMIDTDHYPNGSPESLQADEKRMRNISGYQNIHLYLNYRAFAAHADGGSIKSVDARHTANGTFVRFEAPFFVDCTGDGWIGYWAGAAYSYGRESANQYGEAWSSKGKLWSPEHADQSVMGSSVLWRSENAGRPVTFPEVPWAMTVAGNYAEKNGEWQWEYSNPDLNQIDDAEAIRDHMFRAIYGSFYNFKHPSHSKTNNDRAVAGSIDNRKQQLRADSLQLKWVSYLLGKRESRRLIGDYVYTFNDERECRQFPDSVVFEKREVDVHYQISQQDSTKPDFLSEAMFYKTGQYSIPYRCLYSKDLSNLFMAGRNFSCSHVGLGGPRVMRTTGQMGAATGIAAALCKKYGITPRAVYQSHLAEFLQWIEQQR
ncbi:MAG: FAD-dependent oxidoreductase [Marinilabiliales bacterium]|nr:FAD-dependent oxidoreductase [Marinilabiliales bacterium]